MNYCMESAQNYSWHTVKMLDKQHSSPPLSAGSSSKTPQWMPHTVDIAEPCTVGPLSLWFPHPQIQ